MEYWNWVPSLQVHPHSFLGVYGNAILMTFLAAMILLCVVQLTRKKPEPVKTPKVPHQGEEAKDKGKTMADYKRERLERELLVREYVMPRLIVTIEQAWWADHMTKRERDEWIRKIAFIGRDPSWLPDGWQKILKAKILRERAARTEREKAPAPLPDLVPMDPPQKDDPPPPTAVNTAETPRGFTIGKFRPKAA